MVVHVTFFYKRRASYEYVYLFSYSYLVYMQYNGVSYDIWY